MKMRNRVAVACKLYADFIIDGKRRKFPAPAPSKLQLHQTTRVVSGRTEGVKLLMCRLQPGIMNSSNLFLSNSLSMSCEWDSAGKVTWPFSCTCPVSFKYQVTNVFPTWSEFGKKILWPGRPRWEGDGTTAAAKVKSDFFYSCYRSLIKFPFFNVIAG